MTMNLMTFTEAQIEEFISRSLYHMIRGNCLLPNIMSPRVHVPGLNSRHREYAIGNPIFFFHKYKEADQDF